MPWLNVPHLLQARTGWCLPACVAMVAAYWQQPLLQDDVARWLGTTGVGTPASRLQRLSQHGFEVTYRSGSLSELRAWIARETPCILFVHTRELPYWKIGTPHAVVLAGWEDETAVLFDPAVTPAPVLIPIGDLMLAWSCFDYTYAVLSVPG